MMLLLFFGSCLGLELNHSSLSPVDCSFLQSVVLKTMELNSRFEKRKCKTQICSEQLDEKLKELSRIKLVRELQCEEKSDKNDCSRGID